jgi:hypothetical protein
MKPEYDFSSAQWGKFYDPDATCNFPRWAIWGCMFDFCINEKRYIIKYRIIN